MKIKLFYIFGILILFGIPFVLADSDSYTIRWVIPESDTTPPTFTNLVNHTQQANNSFSYTLNATDDSGIDSFWLNDTAVYQIVASTGIITNVTNLSTPSFWVINVSVNDTEGNIASDVFWINITVQAEGVTTITVTPNCRYKKLGYYNTKLPWIRQEGCL